MRRKFGLVQASVLAVALLSIGPLPASAADRLLRLKLDGPVLESPGEEFGFWVFSGEPKPRTLREMIRALDKAAKDSTIAGMVMFIEQPAMGLAQAEELGRALNQFRATGKKVYCYLDSASNLSYALACYADHLTISENSVIDIVGLAAEMSFYKNFMDKIGVQADMMHCGAYKSALEPYTRTEPSKENAEMVNWLLDGIYARWVRMIADGRKLTPEQVKSAIDHAPLSSAQALERKLVDAVAPLDAFKTMIQKEHGRDVEIVKQYPKDKKLDLDLNNPFAIFQMFSDLVEKAQKPGKPGLGLIYIEGPIVDGKSEPSPFGGASAGSTNIRAAFEKARRDDNIKAVVVRVNSPGGSALASDIMWDAATRLGKEKPLVVSMGNVAGSGGYYVAIPGDTIFAEESTITGSIGVVSGKIVWKQLWEEKVGITTTQFARGKRAGLMSPNRPWSEDERAWMNGFMNDIYEQFKGRVKQSRGDRLKGDLKDLAEGRVFTGKQALERGLVDKLGGLGDAMALAASKAGLEGADYDVYVLPKPKDFGDVLMALMGEEKKDEPWEVGASSAFGAHPLMRAAAPLLRDTGLFPMERLEFGLRNLMILDRERVGCFMPFDLRFR